MIFGNLKTCTEDAMCSITCKARTCHFYVIFLGYLNVFLEVKKENMFGNWWYHLVWCDFWAVKINQLTFYNAL